MVRDDGIHDRETEIWKTGEWMRTKREMILSKWCFISVINPASQEDEEGLSLSPATIVRNKGTLMGPIGAKYQISSLRMILPSRSGGLLNLWPQSHTPPCSTYRLIRNHLHTHIQIHADKRTFISPQTATRLSFHSSSYCCAVCLSFSTMQWMWKEFYKADMEC